MFGYPPDLPLIGEPAILLQAVLMPKAIRHLHPVCADPTRHRRQQASRRFHRYTLQNLTSPIAGSSRATFAQIDLGRFVIQYDQNRMLLSYVFDLDMHVKQHDEHSSCGAISRSFKHPASAFCHENMIEFFWFADV